ncbi:DUF2773 domain-containing protein, partial [Escherichia coli]|uniref:DUF2773 domain-containing protein n=1 Tax=Escherichia coli TaxID=562 RepID=UPI002A35D07B
EQEGQHQDYQRTQYEVYDYPGRFKGAHGQNFARWQMDGWRNNAETARGMSRSPEIWPGRRNRSHWSTSKTPSYTKSVSWQHHPLPDNLQFNFVKRMEKKSPAYFCCRDMQVIHSDAALQRLLTRFNDPEGWSNLAKNQYLSTSMKQKIWQRALSHRKNNPKADSAAYETSADMILSELISHGEVDDQMLLNATALIRLEDWDFLESALVSWDNLPAVVLKELQQNTPRNDIWAKFFLRQENSSRAQVDEALRVYYALDPDALAQLDVLAKQPDRIWWSTLAKSNLTFFKFGALNNRHTPPAVLAAEIDPEWWIVAMNNPRFPVDVLKARLKRDPLLALELVNPELDLVRQLALNGKTRAIREQAMRKLDELY